MVIPTAIAIIVIGTIILIARTHRREHGLESRVPSPEAECEICGERFEDAEALGAHTRTHHGGS